MLLVGLLMPVLALYTPWHPKVVVTLKNGPRLVFHELDRDLEFCLRCVPWIR